MTRDHGPNTVDPALLRSLTLPRLSRRQLLRSAGIGAGALALSPFLAACGGEGTDDVAPEAPGGFDWSKQEKAGELVFANWPYYMDQKRVEGAKTRPSLDRFTRETGIEVEYTEVIEDYASFFGRLRPQLEAGQVTGFDLIVMGYPKWLPMMIELGYLVPLAHSYLPNFERYAGPKYREAPYDPGNRYSIPYQSGITGIGCNIDLTGREITSAQELFNPEFAGRVGMFRDTEDTPNMALIALGVDPVGSTEEDWRAAADLLVEQRDDGIVRQYFGQGYVGALQAGDAALSLAWAADILISQADGYDNLRFVVPDEGGLLWTDSMCIPIGAEHPVDAITYMDFVYQPEVAAMMTAWIQGVSPVPEAQQVLLDQGEAEVANNPLVFPTEDMYERMRGYRILSAEENEVWEDLFIPIYEL